jgi:hypothetical protein
MMQNFAQAAGSLQSIQSLSEVGSPALVSSFGRLFGLGSDEQRALAKGEVPRWAVFALGALAGSVVAVALYKRAPGVFQKISGE